MDNSTILEGLNEDQRQAVMALEGPLLVVAGPGTGKTLTLVRRIANLIQAGATHEDILAVTFTNRAAREMRERANRFLGSAVSRMFIGTFHLLGLRIMRDRIDGEFAVYDRGQQISILKRLTGSQKKAEQVFEKVSRVRNLIEEGDPEIRQLCTAYEKALRCEGAYDFDDLILIPTELLKDPAVRGKYGSCFRYVMVDEYQDINSSQYKFLKSLMGEGNNICAVGDPDQAIYAFRGADVTNFLNFERDFPGASVVTLGTNYRSTETIVQASNTLIVQNGKRIEKALKAAKDRGLPVTVASTPDERGEGEIIVAEIEARVGGTSHYRRMRGGIGDDFAGSSYGFADFAVVFRTNAQARALVDVFAESGIPCRVIGGRKPTKRGEFAAKLRSYADRLPGSSSLIDLLGQAAAELRVSDDDRFLLDQLAVAHGDMPVAEALLRVADELAVTTSEDYFDPRAEAVTLTTFHGVKGLEFRAVFIVGVENGMIPFGARDGMDDTEEERRLFYVGMTRAMDELYLIHSRGRMIHGRIVSRQPSVFVREIDREFLRAKTFPDRPKKFRDRQMELF